MIAARLRFMEKVNIRDFDKNDMGFSLDHSNSIFKGVVMEKEDCELLIKNEKALLTSEVRSSPDRLRALISEDFREIGASGAYFGLPEVLENLPPNAQNWSAVAQNFECHELSENIIQVVFQCVITYELNSEPVYSLRSSIWRREDGHWKILFHQGTKVLPFDILP
jgi:hypothetical protein